MSLRWESGTVFHLIKSCRRETRGYSAESLPIRHQNQGPLYCYNLFFDISTAFDTQSYRLSTKNLLLAFTWRLLSQFDDVFASRFDFKVYVSVVRTRPLHNRRKFAISVFEYFHYIAVQMASNKYMSIIIDLRKYMQIVCRPIKAVKASNCC